MKYILYSLDREDAKVEPNLRQCMDSPLVILFVIIHLKDIFFQLSFNIKLSSIYHSIKGKEVQHLFWSPRELKT